MLEEIFCGGQSAFAPDQVLALEKQVNPNLGNQEGLGRSCFSSLQNAPSTSDGRFCSEHHPYFGSHCPTAKADQPR